MPACLRRSTRLAMVLSLAGAVCAAPARAQSTRAVEGLFSANASILWPAATSVTLSTVADDPPDRAEAKTQFDLGSRPGFDIGGGILVRRRLFLGAAVSRFTDAPMGTLTLTVDHPAFHPRLTATGDVGELKRSERRLDLQFGYAMPLSRRVTVIVFGGPSRFDLSQDLVADFRVSEEFSRSTGSYRLTSPSHFETEKSKASGWGYNVGADTSVMLTKVFGVGALVRYSRATLDVRDPLASDLEDRDVTRPIDAGGLQVSGGIRLHF